ncbi:MAG: phage replication protein [Patescibacteria group bacterium]|nr:phage replication protein [Patescibacteria group bacterium]
MVNTKFWTDTFISSLSAIEKLLFIYLLTNPHTDISGMYEIPLNHISMETGIKIKKILIILKKFEVSEKIIYREGWICVSNFIKHQALNPSVVKGVNIGLTRAPKELIEYRIMFLKKHSLSDPLQSLQYLNTNINNDLNLKPQPKLFKENYGTMKSAGKILLKQDISRT